MAAKIRKTAATRSRVGSVKRSAPSQWSAAPVRAKKKSVAKSGPVKRETATAAPKSRATALTKGALVRGASIKKAQGQAAAKRAAVKRTGAETSSKTVAKTNMKTNVVRSKTAVTRTKPPVSTRQSVVDAGGNGRGKRPEVPSVGVSAVSLPEGGKAARAPGKSTEKKRSRPLQKKEESSPEARTALTQFRLAEAHRVDLGVAERDEVMNLLLQKKAQQSSQVPKSVMGFQVDPYPIQPGEAYMNDKQLNHFRRILEYWRQELMHEVDNTLQEMKTADLPADPNDRASQEEAFSLELRARDRERKLIKKIEEAIQQIDEEAYGYCEGCGVEIGIRRLEARPTATLCIDCKTIAEIKEKRLAG